MFFASDNAGMAHPQVMNHVIAANEGYFASYGGEPIMNDVRARLRHVFDAPDAVVYLVATGTAVNALALACYTQPWHTVFCSPVAHIHEDECSAPEFCTSGAKLTLVPGSDKMTPAALRASILAENNRGVHGPQRGPVSITQVTERGNIYSLAELRGLTAVAKEFGLPVHLDGARFANALVSLGCSAADMTWKSGIDVVSFGGTKNGCMGVEAVVFFDPAKAWEFELRRKRAAHLFSKHRFLSAQMQGYLKDDLWLETARLANARCAYLAEGLRTRGAELLNQPEANMIYARFPRAVHQRAQAAGATYNMSDGPVETGPGEEMLTARLVCDWAITEAHIDAFLAHFD